MVGGEKWGRRSLHSSAAMLDILLSLAPLLLLVGWFWWLGQRAGGQFAGTARTKPSDVRHATPSPVPE